jgi:uncharacterized protein (TIGR03118 family)
MNAKTRVMRHIGISFALALALGVTANARADNGYQLQVLVSDGSVAAKNLTPDPNLVNAWGLAFSATSPAWVADNGTGLSTVYNGNGDILSLVVQIPSPTDLTGGTPTGIVANVSTAATSFPVAGAASRFIFSTEDGIIAGWPGTGTQAIVAVDNSVNTLGPNHAIYKGIALSAGGTAQLLYATDFHNGRVDVFNNAFAPATLPAGAFIDPNLPSGYAPFGIQAISGNIYVTYAKQVPGSNDEAHGKGLGVVDVYDPNGVLLNRVATHGSLNAPWGIAMAPAGFGKFSNSLLIGNFGDGSINAYDLNNNFPLGALRGQDGKAVKIDGLWALEFGNGFNSQPVNTLFFTAGPNDEGDGVFGRIDPPAPSGHNGGGGDDQGGNNQGNNNQGGGD